MVKTSLQHVTGLEDAIRQHLFRSNNVCGVLIFDIFKWFATEEGCVRIINENELRNGFLGNMKTLLDQFKIDDGWNPSMAKKSRYFSVLHEINRQHFSRKCLFSETRNLVEEKEVSCCGQSKRKLEDQYVGKLNLEGSQIFKGSLDV